MAHAPECHGRIYGCLYCDTPLMTINESFDHKCPTQLLIDRGKAEIIEDIRAGKVPRTVKSFGELHDYVDANEYGGLCKDENTHDDNEQAIAVQDALHDWLANGAIRRAGI